MHSESTPSVGHDPRVATAADRLLQSVEGLLRTLHGRPVAARPCPHPPPATPTQELTPDERRKSAALMRVNHVGEVCAQALYQAQALTTANPALRAHFLTAAREEADHLAWTHERLERLGGRPSVLNPLWYAGAFAIGLAAGRAGDGVSLGFVVETEKQVEAHLASHLDRLPAADHESRVIVQAMQADEVRHGQEAGAAGALPVPAPIQWMMRLSAKVMTTTAHHL